MNEDMLYIARALETLFSGVRYTNYRTDAQTGKLNADGSINTSVSEGLAAPYVWVRFGTDRAAVPIISKIRAAAGLPVIVAFDKLFKEDVVLEVNLARGVPILGGDATAYNVPLVPAGIYTPTSARDVQPGAVRVDAGGGLVVRILPCWQPGGAWWDGSTQITLTPTATSNKRSFAVVGITSAGVATTSLTADRAPTYELIDADGNLTNAGAADIDTVMDADTTVFWCGAVLLANGDTAIDGNRIYDLRFWRSSGSSSTTSGIALYHASGSAAQSFTADSTGLDDASAAASSGDVIWIPPATITGNHTLAAGVEYVGAGRSNTILTGQITGANNSTMRNLSITRAASSAAAVIGLLLATGTFNVYSCTISATNSGAGDAVGVKATGGTLALYECAVSGTAATGGGYGTQPAGGAIEQYGGLRSGSDAAGLTGSLSPVAFAATGKDQAVFSNIISPQAYYYNGRTYYAWCGAAYTAYISYFDHAARTWAAPVAVQTDPGSYDNHSCPAVIVANNGIIHIVNGGNSTASIPTYHLVSNNPEDISAWTLNTTIGTATTYHELVKTSDGTIYLFYRKKITSTFYHCYRYTTDGVTWSSEQVAFNTYNPSDALYTSNAAYDATNGRIYMAWSYYVNSATERRHIYIAYLKLSDGHFYAMDGTDLGIEVTALEATTPCILYDSGTDETNQPNIKIESGGTVHVSFIRTVSAVWKHTYTYWTGSAWATLEDVTTAGDDFAVNDLWVNADGTVDLYAIISSGSYGGDLAHWQRSAGGSWSLVRTVFDVSDYASGRDGPLNVQTVGNGAGDVVRVVFADDEFPSTANDLEMFALSALDTYVTSNNGAQLYAVQTDNVTGDVPLEGDRSARNSATYPDLHRDSTDIIHLPVPTSAGKVAISVSDGAGGFEWELQTPSAGTVTSVGASSPIASSGGSTPTISHSTSGVSAGDYSKVTVNTTGHVTAGTTAQYQQFTYTVGGGTFAFVTDGSGNPIFNLEDVA